MTEAVPLAATALLPVVVVPLAGAASVHTAAAPYANPLIFLFLGGFAVALAVQNTGLHRRIAFLILARVGDRPDAILAGFMAATALLSMWVSNTATALMMVPIALSVVDLIGAEDANEGFAPALVLGVAYAASLGGMATLVGTPPNAVFAGFFEQSFGRTVTFVQWMAVGLPVAAVLTAATWLWLARGAFRLGHVPIAGARARIAEAKAALGPWRAGERRTAVVALVTAALWIASPVIADVVPAWSDSGVAIGAALILFLMPAGDRPGRLLGVGDVARLPWDVLLLIGGGLSLAGAMEATGLAPWLGQRLTGLGGLAPIVTLLAIAAVIVLVSELASNTATAAAFLPVVVALAPGLGTDPVALAVPATLAASCGFMLPVGTPPNAIAYATGRVTVGQMARAGLGVDVLGIVVAATLGAWLARLVLAS